MSVCSSLSASVFIPLAWFLRILVWRIMVYIMSLAALCPCFIWLRLRWHRLVSRFLTFDLGRGDIAKLQKTFSTSVNILLLMSIVVVLLSLGIAFALTVSSIDKLIYYGLLVFAIELCIQMMCWISPKLQSNIHWKTITIQNHWFVHFGGYKVL